MLLNDARSVRARLMQAETASISIEEAERLAAKRNELGLLADRIAKLACRHTLLCEAGIPLTMPDISKAKQLVSQISSRFAESPKSITLVDGQRWTRLVATLSEFSAIVETLQKQDWKTYFSSKLFGGVPPDQRKQTIIQALPENKKALDCYTSLYQRFNQYRTSIPETIENLQEVLSCSEKLAEIRFVENNDVPPAVRAFFNATSTGTGASLGLLTQEVLEWLCANNMLANYVVRAR